MSRAARLSHYVYSGVEYIGGTGSGTSAPGEWVDTFISGTTEPIGGVNVGAGVYDTRPFPTENIPIGGAVSYNSGTGIYTITSGTYENYVIPGFVKGSAGVLLVNCLIAGTVAEQSSERQMVEGPGTSGQMEMRFCTIDPTTASAWYNGIAQGVKAVRCWTKNCVDGVKDYSSSSSGPRIRIEDSLLDNFTQFSPDYANSYRAESHNDGNQAHGNTYPAVGATYYTGSKINARHSLTKGYVAGAPVSESNPPYRLQIAALMISPGSGRTAHLTFEDGWLFGGVYCVNAGSDAAEMSSSYLTINRTRFERPGTDAFGDGRAPSIALAVDSSLNFTGSGNTYYDNGAAVPVTSA